MSLENNDSSINDDIIETKIITFVSYCDVYKKFIKECLLSIIYQKYSNYEIIIINDGSENTDELKEFIKNYNNILLIDYNEKNNGPAFSKWKFIEYIQTNIKKYNMNDILCIIDGDDILFSVETFLIINETYQNEKCWFTYGSSLGKFTEGQSAIPDDCDNIRFYKWLYSHPRTFKVALAMEFTEYDFKFYNNWLTKCTDRPLVYHCIEFAGRERVKFIDKILYDYKEHEQNSYKTVTYELKKQQEIYIRDSSPKNKIIEDIHVIMCCWKRIQFLESQIYNLNEQTVSKRIHLHLLNNNINNKVKLDKMIIEFKIKYKNIKISLTHYYNKYYGFQRFIYIKDYLIKDYNIDYVMMIDDDQLFEIDWIENMYNSREPKTYKSWYCKKWTPDNIDYWSGSFLNRLYCKRNDVDKDIDNITYCGTGGSIIDVAIFYDTSKLWDIPDDIPEPVSIFNIEDLYLSFIAKKIYGWKLKMSKFTEKFTYNDSNETSNSVSSYVTLKLQKQLFLEYLIKKYGL